MADYYSQIIVTTPIGVTQINSFEFMILQKLMNVESDNGVYWFHKDDGIVTPCIITKEECENSLKDLPEEQKKLYFTEETGILALESWEQDSIDLYLTVLNIGAILKIIVDRNDDLDHLSVVEVHGCSKMRIDGFGAIAVKASKEGVEYVNTFDLTS